MSKAEAELVVPCGLGNSAGGAPGGNRAEPLVGTAEDAQDIQSLNVDAHTGKPDAVDLRILGSGLGGSGLGRDALMA